VVVATARIWGLWLERHGHDLVLAGVPLFGHWQLRLRWPVVPAAVLGIVVIVLAPRLVARLRWWALLAATWTTVVAWSVALAAIDGATGFTKGVESKHEYLPFARAIPDIPAFLRSFTTELPQYPTHVKAHPPGMVVLLALLDRVGLAGSGAVAGLYIAGGGIAVVAVLVITRIIAGEHTARRAAPFLAAPPLAIWIATSADAFYAGVTIGAVALLAVSATRRGRGGIAIAAAAGVLFGCALHLSYGLVLAAPLAAAVLIARRQVRPALGAAAGASIVAGIFLLLGFNWVAGLGATRDVYAAGVAAQRPAWYFVVGNLGALALAVGPVVAAGATRVRGRLWWLVGAALVGVAAADLSGLSKAEVERIWLFLAIPLTAAAAGVSHQRRYLALHVAAGFALAVSFNAGW